jgi:hypothetical protein
MDRKTAFDRWLRQQLLIMDEDKGRCRKLIARHVRNGQVGSEIISITVPRSGAIEEESITAWGNEIESAIHDDIEGLGGVQSYVVQSFYALTGDKPGGRFTLRERADTDGDEGSEIESEPATKTGLLAQLMRHQEAIMRTSTMGIGQVVASLRNANARQAELIDRLVSEKLEGIAAIEAMKSEEHERKLLTVSEERKQKMLEAGFDKIMAIAPVVVAKLAGKSVPGGNASDTDLLAQGFIESITPEQMEHLQKVFKPEQLMLLFEIFSKFQSREKSNGAITEEGKPT